MALPRVAEMDSAAAGEGEKKLRAMRMRASTIREAAVIASLTADTQPSMCFGLDVGGGMLHVPIIFAKVS